MELSIGYTEQRSEIEKRKGIFSMNTDLLKYVLDADTAPVVVCDTEHKVVYMNPASIRRYHTDLTGRSIMECHKEDSCEKIRRVVEWFKGDKKNNIVHTDYNEKENKDVYMVALRDESGELAGYYEKHDYRGRDNSEFYSLDE